MGKQNRISLLILLVSLILCLFVLIKRVPAYVLVLSSFGVSLPRIDILIVNVSNSARSYFTLLAPIIFMGFVCCVIYTSVNKRDKKPLVINMTLSFLFLFTCLITYVEMESALKKASKTMFGRSLSLEQAKKMLETQH